MKKLIIIVLFLVLTPVYSFSFDKWSNQDYALQGLVVSTLVMDWSQTRYIARNSMVFHENNFILGEHPSVNRVNSYFISSITVNTLIVYLLPSQYRSYWQYATIAVESGFIYHNYCVGIKMRF